MPRPSAADLSLPAASPYQSPSQAIPASIANPTPLSYAGQPIPPAPAANATPTPKGLFNAFKRRWVLGTLVGIAASVSVGLLVWLFLPGGKHEARGVVELPGQKISIATKATEDYDSYRKHQIFALKSRDLLTRTVNDPAIASLDMVRNNEDPVRQLEESLTVKETAPSMLSVTLKGNNLDEMRAIVDSLMKRYVDDATADERRSRIEITKSLEKMEQELNSDIESRKHTIRMMAGSTGATGNESPGSLDLHNLRTTELNRMISQKTDEINALEARLETDEEQLGSFRLTDKAIDGLRNEGVPENILDKLKPIKDRDFRYRRLFVAELNKIFVKEEADQWNKSVLAVAQLLETQNLLLLKQEIELRIDNSPAVARLQRERDEIKNRMQREAELATDPKTSPVVIEWREKLEAKDREIQDKRSEIRDSVVAAMKSSMIAQLQAKIQGLETQIINAKKDRANYKQELEDAQKNRGGNAASTIEVAQLRKSLEPLQDMLSKVQTELIQNRVQTQMDSRARIRETAQPLPNNNLNRKLLISGFLGLGTFFLTILMVAFLEWRTRRVDGVDQVVNELGMRIVGTVPVFPNRASLKTAAEIGGANWRFALNEAINSTRTMLLHSARSQSMQVVMVTSATQGEGKTSLASQLASSMATAGMRTLIVDCDLRNPSIHKLFDLTMSPGVSEILTQDADPTDAVQPTAVPNLWVIPAGQCSNRVVAALAQGHPLETLFNRLRGQFDFVIVDSCPVLPVADALLIGQHVDGVLFSIMQDISQIPKVVLASEKMHQLNIPLLGAVVNGIKQDVYSYGYNYVKQLPA